MQADSSEKNTKEKEESALDKQEDEESSEDEEDQFDVHKEGIIMTLQDLIKLKRRPRKNKKITVDLSSTKYDVIKTLCADTFGWNVINKASSSDWNIKWQDFYINEDDLRRMLPYQKINHFPGSYNLGKKNYLGKNLSKMRLKFPEDYDFCPRTWLLPYQYEDLRSFYEKNKAKKPVFIVKPEASCQGKGIFLVKKFSTMKQDQHMVVQEYIKNPLLIDELKFDFRVYVLVKSVCPLKVFIYREGLARFATAKYQKPSKKNLRNMCMHLTNYAVNKHSPDFEFNQDAERDNIGHKRSFSSILKYLEDTGKDANKVFLEIRQIINKTMCSVQPYLSHLYRSCQLREENNDMCFEVFGFDVMLDSDLKAYLIEVNHTPSFTTDTPLDYHIKHSLILDTLIQIDTRSKAKTLYQESKKMQVMGKQNVKMSTSERTEQQRKLDHFELRHKNGFCKSMPALDDPLNYDKYIQGAQSIHDEFTGTKRNSDRLITLTPPPSLPQSQISIPFSMSSKKQKIESNEQMMTAPLPPKIRKTTIIRRPVSGIPLSQNSAADGIQGGDSSFASQSGSIQASNSQSFQGDVPIQGSNNNNNTTLQSTPITSARGQTNHILKNIKQISSRTIIRPILSPSQAEDSLLECRACSPLNISKGMYNYNNNNDYQKYSSFLKDDNQFSSFQSYQQNSEHCYENKNVRPDSTQAMSVKSSTGLTTADGGGGKDEMLFKYEFSNKNDLSNKLDKLKRELQQAKEEATKCVAERDILRIHSNRQIAPIQNTEPSRNIVPQSNPAAPTSIRPQSSVTINQHYRYLQNNLQQQQQPQLSFTQSQQQQAQFVLPPTRQYVITQKSSKLQQEYMKEETKEQQFGNQFSYKNQYSPAILSQQNPSMQQHKSSEFLSIQKLRIEPKLQTQGTAIPPRPPPQQQKLVSPSCLQFNTQNQQQATNNANINIYQTNYFISSHGADLSLQDIGTKAVLQDRQGALKTRGNSITSKQEIRQNQTYSSQQSQQKQQQQQQQLAQYSHLRANSLAIRSHSFGQLGPDKGFVATVENSQTTTNAQSYAQRKGLPIRQLKSDYKNQTNVFQSEE